jgi:organic radical activating enzyme
MKIKEIKEGLIDSGSLVGMPALFIVLPKTDEEGTSKGVDELLETVKNSLKRYVVVSGGMASQSEELKVLLSGIEDLYCRAVIESDGSEALDLEADLYSISIEPRETWPTENINAFVSAGRIVELKIYIEDEIDLRETLIALSKHDLPRTAIYFLPAGEDLESYRGNAAFLAGECLKYGFRLGERLKFILEE